MFSSVVVGYTAFVGMSRGMSMYQAESIGRIGTDIAAVSTCCLSHQSLFC